MPTYCRLKDGSIHAIFSDNIDEETVDLIPMSQLDDWYQYDPEDISCTNYPYSAIDRTDTNPVVLEINL